MSETSQTDYIKIFPGTNMNSKGIKQTFENTAPSKRPGFKPQSHIICWLIYSVSEIILVGFGADFFGKPEAYILHIGANIIFFYSHYYLNRDFVTSEDRKNLLKPISISLLSFIIFCGIKTAIDIYLKKDSIPAPQIRDFINLKYISSSLWRSIQYLFFSWVYLLVMRYRTQNIAYQNVKAKEFAQRIAKEKIHIELEQAKNAYLKAQINPHLLFNMLNFFQQKVKKYDKEVSEAIIDLGNIMRFAIDSDKMLHQHIFQEEISHTQTLISLYKTRFAGKAYINFTFDKEAESINFIPLILITVTENVFKHGNIQLEDDPARITIKYEFNTLRILTYNVINSNNPEAGFKMGLSNIQRRLQLNYGDRAKINYGAVNKRHFTVEIEVLEPNRINKIYNKG